MHKCRIKCIDAALYTYGIINYVVGCQLLKFDKAIMNNNQRYLVGVEIEQHCETSISKCDKLISVSTMLHYISCVLALRKNGLHDLYESCALTSY